MMELAIGLVIIIGIVSLISTLLIAGKGDKDYRNAVKRNTSNLTWIYVIVILISLIAVGVYISWFA
jgi:cytochrome c biogenesis protein ResB